MYLLYQLQSENDNLLLLLYRLVKMHQEIDANPIITSMSANIWLNVEHRAITLIAEQLKTYIYAISDDHMSHECELVPIYYYEYAHHTLLYEENKYGHIIHF